MNAQNRRPTKRRMANRAPRPFSLAIARARAVSHFGFSRGSSGASGQAGAPAPAAPAAPGTGVKRGSASGVEDIDQVPRRVLPREPQEDLLEAAAVLRVGAQLI